MGLGVGGLTCHSQDAAPGRAAVVLGQGAPGAGAEQEATVGAGGQAGDGSSVTPAPHGKVCRRSQGVQGQRRAGSPRESTRQPGVHRGCLWGRPAWAPTCVPPGPQQPPG